MDCGHDAATWRAADGTCDACEYTDIPAEPEGGEMPDFLRVLILEAFARTAPA